MLGHGFALREAARGGRKVDRVGSQPADGQRKTGPRACRVLEKQVDASLARQQRNPLLAGRPGVVKPLGRVQNNSDLLGRKFLQAQEIGLCPTRRHRAQIHRFSNHRVCPIYRDHGRCSVPARPVAAAGALRVILEETFGAGKWPRGQIARRADQDIALAGRTGALSGHMLNPMRTVRQSRHGAWHKGRETPPGTSFVHDAPAVGRCMLSPDRRGTGSLKTLRTRVDNEMCPDPPRAA